MCIIIAKPKGIKLPDYDTLESCWLNNSHGAGIMWAENGKVHWVKGLMSFDAFITELYSLDDHLPMVLHFRITTSGGTCKECTHPFPVSDSERKLKRLSGKCNIAMAHNGTIANMATSTKHHISDTMAFVRDFVAPMRAICPDFATDPNARRILEGIADSKLCFLDGKGNISTIGAFIEDGGCLYSNTSYRGSWRKYSTSKRSSYSTSDYWDSYSASDYWDSIDDGGKLSLSDYRELLPFEDCLNCAGMEKCALYLEPYCYTKYEANAVSLLEREEVMELLDVY